MGEILGVIGFFAGLWCLVAPLVALMSASRARRRVEELEGRIFSLELDLAQLRDLARHRPAALPAPPPQALPAPPPVASAPPITAAPPAASPEALPLGLNTDPGGLTAHPGGAGALPGGAEALPGGAEALPGGAEALPPELAELPGSLRPTPAPPVAAPHGPAPSIKPWSPSLLPDFLGAQGPEAPAPGPAESAGGEPPRLTSTSFDIEKLLGVRGAAWLGAIALAIAGTLFAKYSIENNLIPPAVRIAFLIILGAAALLGSEWPLRPRYVPTANAVAGAGIAVLYSAFYAGHSLYGLFDTKLTFLMMVLTTVVAALLSMRYDALFIAGLGLCGGFATPLLLSTNQDRPISLFLYVLLLDIGFLVMAVRRGWHLLTALSLLFTVAIEAGWLAMRLTPEKLPIGVGAATIFALLYLALPTLARLLPHKGEARLPESEQANQTLLLASGAAGILPFLLALHIATTPAYAANWPLLYGFLGCLNAALLVVAVRRGQGMLLVVAAVATALSLVRVTSERPWTPTGAAGLWGLSLATLGLLVLPNLGGWLSRRFPVAPRPDAKPANEGETENEQRNLLEAAGLVGTFGLLAYAYIVITKVGSGSPWLVWVLFLALFLFFAERGGGRSGAHGLRFVAAVGGLVMGGLALLRLAVSTDDPDILLGNGHVVVRELAGPLVLAVAYAVLASYRSLRAVGADEPVRRSGTETEVGGLLAVGWGLVGLIYALHERPLAANPGPLLLCLGGYVLLLFCAALRRRWTALLPFALFTAAGLMSGWHFDNYQRSDLTSALLVYGVAILAFLGAPLGIVYRYRRQWQLRRGPYLTSALAGPLFFPVVYDSVTRTIGKGAIGLLPLLFGALAVGGLVAVQGLPKPPVEWAEPAVAARRRLGHRALFAAVALAFLTLSVPLQLDRQWIIVAWALEAAAVMRLFGLLPHPGLKYFGLALYGLVAARLLLDPHVLELHRRGYVLVNWLLYTYGVPSVCFLLGGAWLRQVEVEKHDPWERQLYGQSPRLATGITFVGLLLVFALINLEIADAFSTGTYTELSFERSYARDLTTSLAWALYGLILLMVGMWRRSRALRFVSLGFLVLTILKVFLLDLSNLSGVYRPLSFLGLAASLIVVSLLYQRFVFREEKKGAADGR